MIFSSKAEYGVRLMVELGRQSPEQPTSLKAIADAEGLPLAYLEQVVARLRKAGLVMSARGAHGGYWLARPAEEIAMDEVVQALEGSIAPMECFVHDHTERVLCSHEPDAGRGCATKLLWTRVQGGIIRSLQTTTLAELVEFSRRDERVPSARPRRRRTEKARNGRSRDPKPSRPRRGEGDPPRPRPDRRQGRDPRADGAQRLRQVDARQRDHGSPRPRGDRGPDPLQGRGHHRGRPDERARMGLFMAFQYPVVGAGRDRHQVPAHGAQRPPRGARRGADPAEGVPPDGRGGDEADQRPQGVLEPVPQRGLLRRREEADGDPPARAPAARAGDPRRDRLRPRHRRAARRRQRRQRGRRARHGRADHHPLPADPAPRAAEPRARHVPGPDRQGGRPGARRRARGARATAGSPTSSTPQRV